MKKKLKNNSFLIPSFLAGVTGLSYEKTVHSSNIDSSIQTSNFNNLKNKTISSVESNFNFSKNDEIFDIIKVKLQILILLIMISLVHQTLKIMNMKQQFLTL